MAKAAAAPIDLQAILVHFLRKLGLAEMTVFRDCGVNMVRCADGLTEGDSGLTSYGRTCDRHIMISLIGMWHAGEKPVSENAVYQALRFAQNGNLGLH
jgi:hypothetical protein